MEWYHYLAALFSGAFLANAVPHFVHGISGNKFPTPFAKPRGVGLSSPTLNVAWALANLIIGYTLCRIGSVTWHNTPAFIVSFSGAAILSLALSKRFQNKHHQ